MDRKTFIRNGLLGTAIIAGSAARAQLVRNDIDELESLDIVGFNHLPTEKSAIMDNAVYHPAESRGMANHAWLDTRHSFSFASSYNPERMHFGVLRVLNDDTVAPGMGFGTHPHDNMEIISIPLEGDLEHKDSMGNVTIIRNGDIQVMSAGTGIRHSEYNKNPDKTVKFLQIWVFPNKKNVTPRYDQISLKAADRKNRLQQILSPSTDDDGVWIHQDAWFQLGSFEKGFKTTYQIRKKGNGVYAFLIDGSLKLNGQELKKRDGFGIWDVDALNLEATEKTELLLMEGPMQL
ncbi:MAG: pirin family protein [Bacteroidota bacterium]